ncbi:MAG: potassium transporter Kef [Armatimonadota bacterium]
MDNTWWTAFIWIALALMASLVSMRLALSVALAEILFGVLGGNLLHIQPTSWINFLASLGGVLLTFLAGAEIDPEAMRRYWKPAVAIGAVSFLLPFLSATACAYYLAGWNADASKVAGIALSDTSVAVVYAMMVETGMNRTALGKLTLSACFATGLGSMGALGLFFARVNVWLMVFVLALAGTMAFAPRLTRWFLRAVNAHLSEPQVKLILMMLMMLGTLAVKARSEAVLGAYLLGLALAGTLAHQRDLMHRLRLLTFTLLTPFYFLRAGSYVSVPALWQSVGWISVLLILKVMTKVVGCYPLCRAFRLPKRESAYVTLLMSTGLTFGTIAAMFGLTNGYITQSQYTMLVAVIIGSALAPTVIAQMFLKPAIEVEMIAHSATQQRARLVQEEA